MQVEFFWVLTPCSDTVGYQHSSGPCCLPKPEDAGSKVLPNDSILPQHYTASHPRRTRRFAVVKTSNLASLGCILLGGWSWLRIISNCGLWCQRWWTSGFCNYT